MSLSLWGCLALLLLLPVQWSECIILSHSVNIAPAALTRIVIYDFFSRLSKTKTPKTQHPRQGPRQERVLALKVFACAAFPWRVDSFWSSRHHSWQWPPFQKRLMPCQLATLFKRFLLYLFFAFSTTCLACCAACAQMLSCWLWAMTKQRNVSLLASLG